MQQLMMNPFEICYWAAINDVLHISEDPQILDRLLITAYASKKALLTKENFEVYSCYVRLHDP